MFSFCFPPTPTPPPSHSNVGINVEWIPSSGKDLNTTQFSLEDRKAREFLLENAEKIQSIKRLVITNCWQGDNCPTSKIAYVYDAYTSSFKIPPLAAILIIQEAQVEPAETIITRAFTKFNNQNPLPAENSNPMTIERASALAKSSSLSSWESSN